MASFFQSEGSSPRVGLRGFSSIPGVDSFILGSIRFRIQISSLVRACRNQPGPALGSHGSQRGKDTSPRSYREADEGRIRTRAPGCCICLSPPCSACRISYFSGTLLPLLRFCYTHQKKLHRQAIYLLKVGPKGSAKIRSSVPAITAKPCVKPAISDGD